MTTDNPQINNAPIPPELQAAIDKSRKQLNDSIEAANRATAQMPVAAPPTALEQHEAMIQAQQQLPVDSLATQTPSPVPVPVAVTNPLVARGRLPGETFRLPSRGVFYDDGELDADVESGEVHMYPMTAYEEITLSSASKLFSGEGIIEVIQRCVPSIRKPAKLLAQDVDFILFALRKVSYGPSIEFTKTHVDCPWAKEHEIEPRNNKYVADIGKMLKETVEIDQVQLASKYKTTLSNGQLIMMHPIRFDAFVTLMQAVSQNNMNEMSVADQTDHLLDQLLLIIRQVDEITDHDMIREWLSVITPSMMREVNTALGELSVWGIDTKTTFACSDCGAKMEMELPTNPLVLFS